MKINSGGFGYSKLFRDVLAYPGCYKASLLTETRKTVIKPGEDPVLGDKAVLRHASVRCLVEFDGTAESVDIRTVPLLPPPFISIHSFYFRSV